MYQFVRILVAVSLALSTTLTASAQSRSRRQSVSATAGFDPAAFEAAVSLTDKVTMDRATLMTLGMMLQKLRQPDAQNLIKNGLYDDAGKPESPRTISLSSAQVLSLLLKLKESENTALWKALSEMPEEFADPKLPTKAGVTQATVGAAAKILINKENSAVARAAQALAEVQKTPLWNEIAALTPDVPFEVNVVGGKVIQPGYDDMRVYVNHTYINPKYLYSGNKPRTISDDEFSKVCRKVTHQEALRGNTNSYYAPGTDFAFQCAKDDILMPGTNLVAVLRSFINGTSELRGALPFENAKALAQDLKEMGLENGAAEEVWFNVFEFNLDEVKNAFIANHKKNMEEYFKAANFEKPVPKLRGGIHFEYITEKHPRTLAIFNAFKKHSQEMVATYGKIRGLPSAVKKQVESAAQVFSVPISGLNHQKIVIRDPSNPKTAAVLFLSGNFTNSCLGATGDEGPAIGDLGISGKKQAAIIAKNGRLLDELENAVPNANHAIIVKGFLPAQVTRLQLMKFLKPGPQGDGQAPKYGKDDFPTVGNFRLYQDGQSGNYFDISFSMKGGMGAPDKDLLVPMIQEESDRVKKTGSPALVESMHFVASSKAVNRALLRLSAVSNQRAKGYDYRFVGDTPFSMREYSVIQQLSCVTRRMERSTPTSPFAPKEFYDIFDAKSFAQEVQKLDKSLLARSQFILKECPAANPVSYLGGSGVALTKHQLDEVRSNLRVAPRAYGEHGSRFKIKYNGKIHHKVLLFPHLDLGTIGSSFNISDGANNNHEQLTVVKDRRIVGPIRGAIAFMHLFSPISRASKPAPACAGGKHDGSVYCEAMERTRRLAEADRCSKQSIAALKPAERDQRTEECNEDKDADESSESEG